jgi:glucose/arabinose dehydrogenase
VIRNGRRLRRAFLDIRHLVDLPFPDNEDRDQGGTLSMAFAPDYRRTGRFYVLYTNRDGQIHLDEFHRSRASADRASPLTGRTVLSLPRERRIDLGGDLVFGPDRMLYVGLGYVDDPGSAQDLGVLTGKLLRIDPRPDGARAYRIPPDNPFVFQRGARPETFAYGLRNPWRFSFDAPTGALVIADVGEKQFEEIDVLRRGQAAGANLGWPLYEGRRRNAEGGAGGPLVFPVLTRAHGADTCAIVGGYVVRTRRPRRLRGRYVYGDVCSGQVRSLSLSRPASDRSEHVNVPFLDSFGRDARGRLYGIGINGPVYRIGGS